MSLVIALDVGGTNIRAKLEATVRAATVPEIVVAELGQRAGVIGAALATWKRLSDD